ncbi:MAG: ATP-binding protein [Myxococcota bacterium]
MDVSDINDALFRGAIDQPGVLPHLDRVERRAVRFDVDFGLERLPTEPGILLIRGARQYGKSTWLEAQVRRTIDEFGPGSAFYLNGDEITDAAALREAVEAVVPLYAREAAVRRLFIDEITAVDEWERALKRLVDAGTLERVLVITTGSRATDLRRGAERLPGRKGRLERTSWYFTPVSFSAFEEACCQGHEPRVSPDDAVWVYLLSGGSPVALAELATEGRLSPFVVEIVRDWIHGEMARSGRSRAALMAVMDVLLRRGGTPVGQARLAREAGLANNTVAAGYVEQLADILVLGLSHAWDESKQVRATRRPAKYPFINLLAAVCWHPARLRSVDEFRGLPPEQQASWIEWLVAQELWRRAAIAGVEAPELLPYWSSRKHEVDFVVGDDTMVEVKRGRVGPLDFGWFPKTLPSRRLVVVGSEPFETDRIRGITLRQFLREGPA